MLPYLSYRFHIILSFLHSHTIVLRPLSVFFDSHYLFICSLSFLSYILLFLLALSWPVRLFPVQKLLVSQVGSFEFCLLISLRNTLRKSVCATMLGFLLRCRSTQGVCRLFMIFLPGLQQRVPGIKSRYIVKRTGGERPDFVGSVSK